jgi:hypothetical protein
MKYVIFNGKVAIDGREVCMRGIVKVILEEWQ